MQESDDKQAEAVSPRGSRRRALPLLLLVPLVLVGAAACADWTENADQSQGSTTATTVYAQSPNRRSTTSTTISAARIESSAAAIMKDLERIEIKLADIDEQLAKANDALITEETTR